MSPGFSCRACGGLADSPVLDLGSQPLANNLLRSEDFDRPEPRFPLRLFACPACGLLQLTDLVPPVELFTEYLYFSSFSDAMLRHAALAAQRYIHDYSLGSGSFVVEIASNDGYLLRNFKGSGIPCLGIEPAANIAAAARAKGIETWVDFFGIKVARQLAANGRQADLILANNVFAHAPDLSDFLGGLALLLKPDGHIILEFPYGVEMVEKNEFDTIYHEHVFYFALAPLIPLFRRHGLAVCHLERLPIHGGSLRLFVQHAAGQAESDSVASLLAEEQSKSATTTPFFLDFACRVERLKADLCRQLLSLKQDGKRIAAYGASAKGSTLLNYCGLGRDLLEFVADRSPHKQGRFTPGTHIPIVPAEQLAREQPDYTLLLTWNFADEILDQQKAYRAAGGKFILPIPQVTIV